VQHLPHLLARVGAVQAAVRSFRISSIRCAG
jgi:hypothetical protein